jgi:hypothetical protein
MGSVSRETERSRDKEDAHFRMAPPQTLSLRAKRSNPESFRSSSLDRVVASANRNDEQIGSWVPAAGRSKLKRDTSRQAVFHVKHSKCGPSFHVKRCQRTNS